MQRCSFEIAECPPGARQRLRAQLGVSDTMAQVLVRRGLCEPADAAAFLRADERHDPRELAGIERALAVILSSLAAGERITVHGDYDVDGVCSTAVLVRVLGALGADVDHYIPDRSEGYGLSSETVRRLAGRGTRLLVTADCAVTAVEEVEEALALGMAVVVTDHHSPRADGVLPRAPLVHPAICGYPCPDLCAAGVAHKLAEALVVAAAGSVGAERVERAGACVREDLDLVALATVADLVPLRGENRRLVREGLRALAATRKPGLRALMEVAGLAPGALGERALGFALAPRINAAGRLYRADAALELVLCQDPARAREIARELDAANHERRRVELGIRLEAEAQMDALGELPAYVLAGEGWHHGVIGIVASRLVERSGRPVVLVGLDGELGRGSGRSIERFDLLAGLRACEGHLRRYGGHRAAAGLELDRASLAGFSRALVTHAAASLSAGDDAVRERVDALVRCPELGMELAEELAALAPFGRGNPQPVLMLADARFASVRAMGEGRHARFEVVGDGARARAVAFGCGGRLPVAEDEPVEATFGLEVNEWNGVSEPRLVLRRAQAPHRRSEPGPELDRRLVDPAGEQVDADGQHLLFA